MDVSKVQELAKKAGVKSVDDAIAFALGFKEGVRVKEEDKKPRTDGKTCVLYVIFYWISHSHLFNKLEIHITFIYLPYISIYSRTSGSFGSVSSQRENRTCGCVWHERE